MRSNKVSLRALTITLLVLVGATSFATESILKPYRRAERTSKRSARDKANPHSPALASEESPRFSWLAVTGTGQALLTVGLVVLFGAVAVRAFSSGPKKPETKECLASTRTTLGPAACSIALAPDGRDIFTPFETDEDRLYTIRISGVCAHLVQSPIGPPERFHCDPFYRQDPYGNFTDPHDKHFGRGLLIDGYPLKARFHQLVASDCDRHVYEFCIDGTGQKLAIRFVGESARYEGRFAMTVGECPEAMPLADRVAMVFDRKAEEAEQREHQQFEDQVARTVVASEMKRNWADPEFRAAAAGSDPQKFLREHADILAHHMKLHFESPALLARLKEDHPEVLERLDGMLEAFLIAERLSVARGEARPRLTPCEFRQRMVRRLGVTADDELAIIEAEGESWERKASRLRSDGADEDEIERILGQKTDEIEGALDLYRERKEGKHGSQIVTLG